MKRVAWIAALLACGIAFVYEPVRGHGFSGLDDAIYVTGNLDVQRGLSAEGLRFAFTSFRAGFWHPLTWLSHMADVELHGLWAGGHLLTNVVLHTLSTLLLFAALARMTRAHAPSAFVAALFALHPLHVESVAWVSERKDVLSAFFWMLVLYLYARHAERPSPARYAVTLIAFVCGMAAKPMLVTLPFVLLLLDAWPLGRAGGDRTWKRLVLEKLPFLAISAAACVAAYLAQVSVGAVAPAARIPLVDRLANGTISYAWYLGKTVWPTDLAPFYPHPSVAAGGPSLAAAAASALLLLVLSLAAYRARHRAPAVLVGWLWYLGTLVPVIGWVQVGAHARGDRYTYIPLVGIFVAVAFGLASLALRSAARRSAIGLACVALALFTLRARDQVHVWRDDETLARHTLAVTEGNWIGHLMLGTALRSSGRLEEAAEQLARAISLHPGFFEANNNLAAIRMDQGLFDEAAESISSAIRIEPDDAIGYTTLGVLHRMRGDPEQALIQFAAALERDPQAAEALNGIGSIHYERGELQEAARFFREAVRVHPFFAPAHNDLGLLAYDANRLEESEAEFRRAIEIDPALADAHNNLGILLQYLGRTDEARASYEEAIRVAPDHASAHGNLGLLHAVLGDRVQAIHHYRRAIELDPEYVDAHNNLAAELIEQGHTAEAERSWLRALEVDPDHATTHENLGYALAAQGEIERALHHLGEVLRIRPDYEHADYVRELMVQLRTGKTAEPETP